MEPESHCAIVTGGESGIGRACALVLARAGHPVALTYHTADARWRIGWIAFDADYGKVVDRCIEPLLVRPPPKERAGVDIAFAASCLDRAPDILLYYSLEDRLLRRAVVRQLRAA